MGIDSMKMTIRAFALATVVACAMGSPIPQTNGDEPCCKGACTTSGEEKYYSIASGIFGDHHCGECCMDPSKYNLYHFFEKNLTKAASASPCEGFGYTKYDSTVTHGFGPVKMTLDLYDKPSSMGNSSEETCSLYEIDGATCGQSELDCKYAKYAKDFQKGLQDGTCSAQGYTVAAGTKTIKVPVVGAITIAKYTKGTLLAACDGLSSQSACDAASDCSWCKCAAVPSKCYSKEDAKKLPPGVFSCDSSLQVGGDGKCDVATGLQCAAAVEPCISKCKGGLKDCIECLGPDYATCCPCIEKIDPKIIKCNSTTPFPFK